MGVGESGGVGGEVGKERAEIEKGEVGIGKEEIEGKVEMNIEDVQVFFGGPLSSLGELPW